jgi:hypothetical protein
MIRLLLIPPAVFVFVLLRRRLLEGWRNWREFAQIVFLSLCLGVLSGFVEDGFMEGLRIAFGVALGGTLFGLAARNPSAGALRAYREADPGKSAAAAAFLWAPYLILVEMVVVSAIWLTGWMGTAGRVVSGSMFVLTLAVFFFADYRIRHSAPKDDK